jgi:hypothetical protein
MSTTIDRMFRALLKKRMDECNVLHHKYAVLLQVDSQYRCTYFKNDHDKVSYITIHKLYNDCNHECCFIHNDCEYEDGCYNYTHKTYKMYYRIQPTATQEDIIDITIAMLEKFKKLSFCISCQQHLGVIEELCERCIIHNFIEKNEEQCCICLNPLIKNNGQSISICDNSHYIHKMCMKQLEVIKCPLCRKYHECEDCC